MFDGSDDFVEVQPMPGIGQFTASSFSLEFIIEAGTRQNAYEVLLYQENRFGVVEFGLQNGLTPYLNFYNEIFLFEEVEVPSEGCVQLSIVYESERLSLFLNCIFRQSFTVSLGYPIMEENLLFYLGQRYPDGATSFSGRMEDMRIFRHALSPAEIQQRLFKEVEMTALGKYIHLTFFHYLPAYTCDPYNPDVHAFLGGPTNVNSYMPEWGEDGCMDAELPESVDPSCQTDPTLMPTVCNTTGLPTNEFLCNGDFEQFCSLLQNPPANSSPPSAFWNIPPSGPATVPASDVVNWSMTNSPPSLISSPDFFVRDGLGSPIDFQPDFFCNTRRPNDTHNGSGNGAVGLMSGNVGLSQLPSYEAIITDIRNGYTISPGTSFTFSGWFYTHVTCFTWLINQSDHVAIEVELTDDLGNRYLVGSINLTDQSFIPNNNRWQNSSLVFTAPSLINGAFSFEKLTIRNNGGTLGQNYHSYVYVDDLSLVENVYPPTTFPAYLNTGDANDFFKRIIKEDANGNIYIAGQIIDPTTSLLQFGLQPILANYSMTNQEGSFIAKYASDGTLIWTFFEEFFMVNDMEIIGNEVFAVGYSTPFPSGIITAPFSLNGLPATGPSCLIDTNGGPLSLATLDSENLCIARLSASTGNLIGNIEVWGSKTHEQAIGVEVFGNTAKIALDMCGTGSNLLWNGLPVLNDAILEYDLTFYLPFNFLQLSVGNDYLIDFDSYGNDWFLLTNTSLIKEGGPSQTLPNIGAQTFSAHDLLETSGGDLFLAYNENNNAPPVIEKRDNATLNSVGQFNAPHNSSPLITYAVPLSIAGTASTLFVAYEHLVTSSPMNQQLRIEKYDFSSSTAIPLWSSGVYSSNGANARFAGDLGGAANSPMDMVERAIGGVAVFGNFVTDSPSWTWNLPPKNLTYNGTPALPSSSHSFVAVVNDQGSNGIFGKNGNSVDEGISQSQVTLLYPNPLNGHKELTIQSPFTIWEIQIISLHGQVIQQHIFEGIEDELTLHLLDLPSGIYLIQVNGLSDRTTKKLVVE